MRYFNENKCFLFNLYYVITAALNSKDYKKSDTYTRCLKTQRINTKCKVDGIYFNYIYIGKRIDCAVRQERACSGFDYLWCSLCMANTFA